MRKLSVLFFAVPLYCLVCLGQTNSPAPRHWFSLPSPQLRPLTLEAAMGKAVEKNNFSPTRPSVQATQNLTEVESLSGFQNAAASEREFDANQYVTSRLPERMTLLSPPGEADLRTYRLLEESGHLKRPVPTPDNMFVRVVSGIFEPAPVRIGKTTVACSVVTAIKKKNPLCLLNPMVLSISW
jgi:hypothetical protein